MRTSVETLEGNKVKLTVEVDEEELRSAEDETLRRLTKEVTLPGFRPGKVPRRLIQSRLGPKTVREEVLRDALPRYYEDALQETELDVITSPEIDVTSGEESGAVVFDAVVEVRPEVTVVGYGGLRVTVPALKATDEDVDAQVKRLREQFATLTEVDRPARDGDVVTLNVNGTRNGIPADGLSADDLVYEVGTDGIVDGADAVLRSAKAGDVVAVEAESAPGGPASLKMLVKQVREKILPEADDEFASDASEFDTYDELRADLSTRISEMKRLQASATFRELALEALVELVQDDPPASLVSAESEELLHGFSHQLTNQRISFEDYLEATGQDSESVLADFQVQAVKQVKADLALRALATAEDLVAEESDIDDELVRLAAQTSTTPARLRNALEQDGRIAGLRSQLRNAKALTWLLEHVETVDEEGSPVDRSELLSEDSGAQGDIEAVEAADSDEVEA